MVPFKPQELRLRVSREFSSLSKHSGIEPEIPVLSDKSSTRRVGMVVQAHVSCPANTMLTLSRYLRMADPLHHSILSALLFIHCTILCFTIILHYTILSILHTIQYYSTLWYYDIVLRYKMRWNDTIRHYTIRDDVIRDELRREDMVRYEPRWDQTMRCDTRRDEARRGEARQDETTPCPHRTILQHSSAQHSTAHHSTAHHTTPHRTAPYHTIICHNTILLYYTINPII